MQSFAEIHVENGRISIILIHTFDEKTRFSFSSILYDVACDDEWLRRAITSKGLSIGEVLEQDVRSE